MATIELTQDNLDQIIDANETVVIDFWASWCGPCRAFGPVFEAASEKHKDVVFAKVNTETQPELAEMFGVRSIPTLFAFKQQIGVFEQAGALPAAALEQVLDGLRELDMDEVRKSIEEHEHEGCCDHDHGDGHDHNHEN